MQTLRCCELHTQHTPSDNCSHVIFSCITMYIHVPTASAISSHNFGVLQNSNISVSTHKCVKFCDDVSSLQGHRPDASRSNQRFGAQTIMCERTNESKGRQERMHKPSSVWQRVVIVVVAMRTGCHHHNIVKSINRVSERAAAVAKRTCCSMGCRVVVAYRFCAAIDHHHRHYQSSLLSDSMNEVHHRTFVVRVPSCQRLVISQPSHLRQLR
jgi:hypothetical protein